MHINFAFLAALSLSLSQRARGKTYYLKDQWRGDDFFQGWTWETEDDPTHGRVNYVSQDEARSKHLAYADGDKFIMRADDLSIVKPSARGRDSVRISSQNAYDEAIFVLDLTHMPAGCSTWPAFWTTSQTGPWPAGGEIDIIEGINLRTQNQANMHTTPGCTMPSDSRRRSQTGTTTSNDCNSFANSNKGCGVILSGSGPSYGSAFNLNGGGYYVVSKSRDSGIRLWFWPRNSPNIPSKIARGGVSNGEQITPDTTWGEPAANFPTDAGNCNYDQYFNVHKMIFDLTFCGDWAGSHWATSGCGSGTCEDFVNNQPTSFQEAYWEINSLRVYTPRS